MLLSFFGQVFDALLKRGVESIDPLNATQVWINLETFASPRTRLDRPIDMTFGCCAEMQNLSRMIKLEND